MRICLVYDCLFPNTVGGAERWYRNLAEKLVEGGHDVTYLTLRQWDEGAAPEFPGVRVVAVAGRHVLYEGGRRRISPALAFGAGVLRHLLRDGGRYDIVHTASFPYFSLLAAGLARRRGRYRLFVDWIEVWSSGYWREYLGPVKGFVGWAVQKLAIRLDQEAFCLSRLHTERLRTEGFAGEIVLLSGLFAGKAKPASVEDSDPVLVFAGRHIPEKRVPAIVPAVARARLSVPNLRAQLFGDGPDRPKVLGLINEFGLNRAVEAPGFVPAEQIEEALGHALCLVLPSRREGYGLVVVEAAAQSTPSVVVTGPDNAAAELVEDGVNGVVAPAADAEALASAIVRVHRAGPDLRASTQHWFEENRDRLSIDRSVERVLAAYAGTCRCASG